MTLVDNLLLKAQQLLENAIKTFGIDLYEDAGRNAYLSGFNAARALLFVVNATTFKTHKGLRAEFSRIAKDNPHFDFEMQKFLSQTYELKAIADYEEGEGIGVSKERAEIAIEHAKKFLVCCTEAIKNHREI